MPARVRSRMSSAFKEEGENVMDRWSRSRAITANEPSFWKPYTTRMAQNGRPRVVFDAARLNVFREVVRCGSLSAAAQLAAH